MHSSIEVTEANFEAEVLKSSRPVLVDFATEWSLSSTMLDGALDELAVELADCLKVAYVKLDRNPNLGLWYGIRCIPTMLCFVNGEERVGIFGTTSKEIILCQLKPIINLQQIASNHPPNGAPATTIQFIPACATQPAIGSGSNQPTQATPQSATSASSTSQSPFPITGLGPLGRPGGY